MTNKPMPLNLDALTEQLKELEPTPTAPSSTSAPDAPSLRSAPVTDNAENQRPSELSETYYDHQQKHYWRQDALGNWMQVNEMGVARKLRTQGIRDKAGKGEISTPMDHVLVEIQANNVIHYSAPLAGHQKGVQTIHRRRILVTESPRLIEPVPGEWPLLAKILENMLDDPIRDQRPYFLGWLKVAVEALHAKKIRPGQALALAGPKNCGKSLWQNLITELLGGRVAKPYAYMTGRTSFNSELFAAEHLMIEDEAASTDMRARRAFGAELKNMTVNENRHFHAKHREALALNPFWRLTISVNDEPENLMVLPPLDESIVDKIILLRARCRPMPIDTSTASGRQAFSSRLTAELPHLVHHLFNWSIPTELVCGRFGVKHYHHPDLLRAITDLSSELRLLSLVDGEIFHNPCAEEAWEDTAEALERRLTGPNSHCRHEAQNLFKFNTACGVFLRRLAKLKPDRVSERRVQGRRLWKIEPPSQAVTGENAPPPEG